MDYHRQYRIIFVKLKCKLPTIGAEDVITSGSKEIFLDIANETGQIIRFDFISNLIIP